MVVAPKRQPPPFFLSLNSRRLRYIRKFSITPISKQPHTIGETDCQIRFSIVIKIPRRASHPFANNFQSRLLRQIREFSIAQISQQPSRPTFPCPYQKQILLPITTNTNKTRPHT